MWPLAHGIGSRSDLPVPLWLAQYGGAAALVVSFVVLVAFWKLPRFEDPDGGRPLPGSLQRVVDAPATRLLLRLLGLAMGAAVILVAVLGPPSPAPTRRRPGCTCGSGSGWSRRRCCWGPCGARSTPSAPSPW
jgi:hypothetical protein